MDILKYFICFTAFICYMPLLYSQDSKKTSTKKSINIKKSKNYKVTNFTNINISEDQTKQKPKEEAKQKQDIATQNKKDTESKPNKKNNEVKLSKEEYEAKLRYLHGLRYEVMSLKTQLGDNEQISVPYGNYIDKKTSAQRFNALTQSYNDALKKSGLFAGVSFGVLDIYTSGYKDNQFITTRITPIVIGGSGGYQKFFNHYVGTRLYGGLFTSFFSDVYTYDVKNGSSSAVQNPYGGSGNLQSFYMLAFMSADLLFEFPLDNTFTNYIGGFMGLNIGIMYYRPYALRPSSISDKEYYYPASFLWNYNLQVDYSFNLGMSLTLDNVHRIELGLGIPFSYLSLPGFSETANILETTATNFWRSAVMLLNYKLLIKF